MADRQILEAEITEDEVSEMTDIAFRKMTYRCLCAIFSEIREIKEIVELNRKASRFVWGAKTMTLAGLSGFVGAIFVKFGATIAKYFGW
jgi:hypothetical protein